MTRQLFIEFLKKNQPMSADASDAVVDEFRAATAFFFEHPDETCIPLLIGGIGSCHDGTLIEAVSSVLRQFPQDVVVEHLERGLDRVDIYTRINSANLVKDFADDRLTDQLIDLLGEDEIEARLSAAEALEAINSPKAQTAAERVLEHEEDDDVREILADIVDPPPRRGSQS